MISVDDFKKLDLRVAKIVSAQVHPNADKLVVLTVDVGDQTKQIVAGIRTHYTLESLAGKSVVVVNNIAPVTLRGVESTGMVLAAKDEQGQLCLVIPENPQLPAGSRVS